MTPTIEQADLDRATRGASRTVDAALAVIANILEAQVTGAPLDPERLRDAADETNEQAQRTYRLLADMGGQCPDMPARTETPIHLLTTPNTRRLLDALRYAVEVA